MVSDKKQLTKVETKREDPTRCLDKKNFKNVKPEKHTPLLSTIVRVFLFSRDIGMPS